MNKMFFVLLLFSVVAMAAPPPPPANVVAPLVPPAPPSVRSGEVLEPNVKIIQTENETVYEYRAGAHLYMVRIVPRVGRPYFYFDQDGDGELDFQQDDPRMSKVNQWVLWRW